MFPEPSNTSSIIHQGRAVPFAMLITYWQIFKESFYASSDTSLSAWEPKSLWSPKYYCFRRFIWRSLITVLQLGSGPNSFSSSLEYSVRIWSTVELRITTSDDNGRKQQYCFIITRHAKSLWTRKERISPPSEKKSEHVNCLLTANGFFSWFSFEIHVMLWCFLAALEPEGPSEANPQVFWKGFLFVRMLLLCRRLCSSYVKYT